jgi:hypothetical protein
MGTSKLFKRIELENFEISSAHELFLFFLPYYSICTPLSHMLSRGYFDLFEKFYPNIVRYFDEFVNTKYCIEKKTSMIMYIFEYRSRCCRSIIEQHYRSLCYDINYFEDDESGMVEEIHKKVMVIHELMKKVEEE